MVIYLPCGKYITTTDFCQGIFSISVISFVWDKEIWPIFLIFNRGDWFWGQRGLDLPRENYRPFLWGCLWQADKKEQEMTPEQDQDEHSQEITIKLSFLLFRSDYYLCGVLLKRKIYFNIFLDHRSFLFYFGGKICDIQPFFNRIDGK